MDPQIAEFDGGKTNAAFQRWNAQMRARLEGNAQQDNGRFKDIQTTITRTDGYLESVWTMQAIAGPVVTGMTLFSSTGPDPSQTVSRVTFQADIFQIQTATGNHKEVFSTSADAIKLGDVLTVDLVNARVYIGTGTYGNANTAFYVDDDGYFSLKNKLTFDPTGAGTLTVTGTIVATAGSIGGWDINTTTISKNNAVLDSAGQLFLGTANDIVYLSATDATYRLWAGNATAGSATFSVTKAGAILSTSGNIAGWTLSTTTISRNNATLDSAGQLILGTANDIIYISATDATYRIWAGNVTAGSASFSVTKAGVLYATGATISGTITATSGTIGGFTIGATELTGGTGIETLSIYSNGGGIALGNITGTRAIIYADVPNSLVGFALFNSANTLVGDFYVDTTFGVNAGAIDLYNSAGTATVQFNAAGVGAISTGLYIGSGSSLTNLNASNISSGTIANARLPSAISVTTVEGTSYVRIGDGSTGTPGLNFTNDTDTGWRLNSAGDMRGVTSGSDRLVIRDAAIVCLVPLKLDNAYVAGAVVPTGTLTLQDSAGTTYRFPVLV
jgi:hypothetical protein